MFSSRKFGPALGRTAWPVCWPSEFVVGAIAVGFLGRVLAAAQGDLGFGRQLEFDWGKVAALVAAIAKGLGFGFAAGAPPVGAGFEV